MQKELDYLPLLTRVGTPEQADGSFSPDPDGYAGPSSRRAAQPYRNLSLWLASAAALLSICTLAVAGVALSIVLQQPDLPTTLAHDLASPPPPLPSTSYSPRPPSFNRTVVGSRKFGPLYVGCSSSELRRAISGIRVNMDGAARVIPPTQSEDIADFQYSFDWPEGCPRPHVFTSAEACDLVGAFGALTTSGDSYTRHLVGALFIILRNRPDGAVWNPEVSAQCRGDHMFDDGKACRHWIVDDSHSPHLAEPVCGGNVRMMHHEVTAPVDPGGYIPRFLNWRTASPSEKTALSPIIINSWGLHSHLIPSIPVIGAIKPLLNYARTQFPAPIPLWMSIHAPGSNKPLQYLAEQGPDQVKAYNAQMELEIAALAPQHVLDGGMAIIDWYGMTLSAWSFDGSHYMYQINMEKAMLLLNLLDVLWQESVSRGGLWEIDVLCPEGHNSYQCWPERYYHANTTS